MLAILYGMLNHYNYYDLITITSVPFSDLALDSCSSRTKQQRTTKLSTQNAMGQLMVPPTYMCSALAHPIIHVVR